MTMAKKSEMKTNAIVSSKGLLDLVESKQKRKKTRKPTFNEDSVYYEDNSQSCTSSSSLIEINTRNNLIGKNKTRKTFLYDRIAHFLIDLAQHREYITSTIRAFDEYIIVEKELPKFTQPEIMLLLIGDLKKTLKESFII